MLLYAHKTGLSLVVLAPPGKRGRHSHAAGRTVRRRAWQPRRGGEEARRSHRCRDLLVGYRYHRVRPAVHHQRRYSPYNTVMTPSRTGGNRITRPAISAYRPSSWLPSLRPTVRTILSASVVGTCGFPCSSPASAATSSCCVPAAGVPPARDQRHAVRGVHVAYALLGAVQRHPSQPAWKALAAGPRRRNVVFRGVLFRRGLLAVRLPTLSIPGMAETVMNVAAPKETFQSERLYSSIARATTRSLSGRCLPRTVLPSLSRSNGRAARARSGLRKWPLARTIPRRRLWWGLTSTRTCCERPVTLPRRTVCARRHDATPLP